MDSHRFDATFEPFPPPCRGLRRVDRCKKCGLPQANDIHGMTYEQLFQQLAAMRPEERVQPVRWWGEERGGIVLRADRLPEPYVNMSEGEGLEPLSLYIGTLDEETARAAIALPEGTLILAVD